MSRPPDVRKDNLVDAVMLAGAGSSVEREYSTAELPRLTDAGAADGSAIDASLRFSEFDGRPAVEGRLTGQVALTCQRCLRPMTFEMDESFQVVVVSEERADEPGGYEPVVADPARLDLRWFVEDQALLALPLVPLHEPGECDEADEGVDEELDQVEPTGTQKPFQNLRDMMRKR
jgi:uncharacterized protein